jgi:glutathione synthase/RimK-type ligase-like ATP-grasp enzyme
VFWILGSGGPRCPWPVIADRLATPDLDQAVSSTLRIATCATLPEPDVDEAPLAEALARAGFDATLIAWDDPAADWDAPIPTILRSTWNYALAIDRFVAWIDRVARAAPLLNPREVVLGNVHKRYLLALEARGVPIVPTLLIERHTSGARLEAALAARNERFVIKPEVGAGSLDARAFEPGDPEALPHLAALIARGAALIQPYLRAVEGHGERSIVWIDGEPSHAIRKTSRFSGDAERITGPFPIADDERAVASAALAGFADLLYARVDVVRDDAGQPRVMELELVEPSLFFAHRPGSADRYATALRRRLDGD